MSEQNNYSFCDLTSDVNVIERSFVADSTTDKYLKGLVQFMIWLFDNHPEILNSEMYSDLITEDEKDKAEREQPRPVKKHRKYKKKIGGKGRG